MGDRRDFSDRALGGLDDRLAEGQERRRTFLSAMDSGLASSLPLTCLILAAGLGWTYAYLPHAALLGGAACFAAAAVTGFVGLRRDRGPLTAGLLVVTAVLGVAGIVLLGAGVN